MIHLQCVTKKFGSHTAVDGIDLDCPTGKTQVLIGTSGCGKSTLLRMMVGLVKPDSGSVLFDNEPLLEKNLETIRRRIGYMIQEGGLFPHLTARDNAAIMPRYLGWDSTRTEARLQELLELTQLPATLLDRFPRQLSGGQRQRVSLMRALMLDPDVLLLDEPLGDLDPMIRAELQQDLRTIFRELDKTVVLVTHDLGEAGFLGDTITLLRAGRIVQQGSFEELLENPVDDFASKFVQAQRQVFA
ncbi:ATP-binding cassette domain-containing protein [Bythopirellula goksoeyrii]|uniref:Glycine betaine/carnitine/choline transport ATP-binding protein OpuCA n=1 Tax=Bythopirellula goksoeyrii TaxID=1400387 RepID=A0A5B9QBW8_9BACT|nr:ATP-binding cassette domain-containing protein [Bythopirellula goksoeyrii]QEG36547.1 Glycine betaine/carnitine/choline transport ATP-binding protein OpuCA [Bythopirellula goksoeyrii]